MTDHPVFALSLRRLGYAINGAVLVDDVSIDFRRGACTMLLGPNGAGKTLLMKMAHGLVAPTRGNIIWHHRDGRQPRNGMVAQKPLMMRRTTHANIVHALALAGVGYRERHARAAEVLRQFRLDHVAQRPATRLSGGEQQRLAIARAAALNPDVIFLDEPTAALDPAATRDIEGMIGILKQAGVTVIMSTHALPQARRLADDVVLLHQGKVVEHAPASDFFNAPQTAQARTFLAGDLLL
ncbi:MAG: ATP-binding cassette domain-containing protein [Beijerinckiaceae bacterium]